MQNNTDDKSNESSEAAEVAPSTTSGSSKNPIGQNKAPDSATNVATTPVASKDDGIASTTVGGGKEEHPGAHTAKQSGSKAGVEKIQTGMVPVARLRPYARNAEIYEDREDALFTENIRKNGVLTDLVVTEDGEVLGGNRRLREAKRLGLLEVPVKVVLCKSEDEKMLRVLDDNDQRVKNIAEVIREYELRLKIEIRQAKQRKVDAAKKASRTGKDVQTVPPPKSKKGKARDFAAEKLGMSGVTAEKGRKVLLAVVKAREQGKAAVADELLAILNGKGCDPALRRAESLDLIKPPQARSKPNGGGRTKNAEGTPQKPTGQKPVGGKADSARGATLGDGTGDKQISDASDSPTGAGTSELISPVEQIINHCRKALETLNDIEIADLTFDQRQNLSRALAEITQWSDNHSQMLQGPRKG